MENDILPQIWRSGDWSKRLNKEAPYNGIKISGLPQYDENGILLSVAVTFTDYTLDNQGVENSVPELTTNAGRVDISPPTAQKSPISSPPRANMDFTIQGDIALETTDSKACLRIRLNYGLEHMKRDEIGYVMCFKLTVI